MRAMASAPLTAGAVSVTRYTTSGERNAVILAMSRVAKDWQKRVTRSRLDFSCGVGSAEMSVRGARARAQRNDVRVMASSRIVASLGGARGTTGSSAGL